MGQRGNYILKQKGQFSIFYTHWRANMIAKDVLLGPKRFVSFVQRIDQQDELIEEPWIEGCVMVDLDTQTLMYWELELLQSYSVRQARAQIVKERWPNWEVQYAEKEMYDIQQHLGIHSNDQPVPEFEIGDINQLIQQQETSYLACLLILKQDQNVYFKNCHVMEVDQLALLGEQILPVLGDKPNQDPAAEADLETEEIIYIDADQKKLYVNYTAPHLQQQLQTVWKDWIIEVGNFTYLKLLKATGYDISNLQMEEEEIQEELEEILELDDDFDPQELAQSLGKQIGEGGTFNPHFFEDIKPKKTFWERIKDLFN